MFKRILLTAVLGAGLMFTVPAAAEADHSRRDWDRKDHWGIGETGYHALRAGNTPFWHFRGLDRHRDLYWYPAGYGAGSSYYQGHQGYQGYQGQGYWGGPVLNDVFGDDYYGSYGYRCNGYREGYYYGSDGRPIDYYGRPFYRRNADCESYYRRHGSWYGFSDCSRFEVEKGYCDDYDRHGHQKF